MNSSEVSYGKFYNLEDYLLNEVGPRFRSSHDLAALDLYLILVWKANRSKTKARNRLAHRAGGSFQEAARLISRDLASSTSSKEMLKQLMDRWGFRLPTATALLTVLQPTEFTVYDIRVCSVLERFEDLAGRKFSDSLWDKYLEFKACVEAAAPTALSLRDKDRYLWGKSLYEDCRKQCT
jgi:hypothetical protein